MSYLDRTRAQIRATLIEQLRTANPNGTDLSDSNEYMHIIDTYAGIAELESYYIDNMADETHLVTLQTYRRAIQEAYAADYKVIGTLPYKVDVRFMVNTTAATNLTIPAGTIIASGSIQYITEADIVIETGTTFAIGQAFQYVNVTDAAIGTSAGIANQTIIFNNKIVHNSLVLLVDGVAWNSVDTLAFSAIDATDFVQTVSTSGACLVYTGDATTAGAIPAYGSVLTANYRQTLGLAGFVDADQLTTIINPPTLVGYTLTVTNDLPSYGGSEVESLELIKRHIMYQNRTKMRAVTPSDYDRIAEMVPGVLKAKSIYNCDLRLSSIYVIPTDGGAVVDSALLSDVEDFMADKVIVGRRVSAKPAGINQVILNISVNLKPGHSNTTVTNTLMAMLLDMFTPQHNSIFGSFHLSDIYQAIENTVGVDYSNVNDFHVLPYPRKSDTTTPYVVWTVISTNSPSNVSWTILFSSSTAYSVYRQGVLQGTSTVGGVFSHPEISFSITGHTGGSFNNNDTYTFVNYPKGQSTYTLVEPNTFNLLSGNLTLTVKGGI